MALSWEEHVLWARSQVVFSGQQCRWSGQQMAWVGMQKGDLIPLGGWHCPQLPLGGSVSPEQLGPSHGQSASKMGCPGPAIVDRPL